METGTNLGRRRSRETAGSESSGHGDLIATSRNLHAGHRAVWERHDSSDCHKCAVMPRVQIMPLRGCMLERCHMWFPKCKVKEFDRIYLGRCFAKLENALVTLVLMLWMTTWWIFEISWAPRPKEHSRERGHMAAAEELWRRADCGRSIAAPRALQSIAGLAMNLCLRKAVERRYE